MATYKALMRPALEYASSVWSPIASSTMLGNGATSEAGKSLFRAASVWWRCTQYFVIASCG